MATLLPKGLFRDLGVRPEPRLPDRVRSLISRQEAESERLISWAQLAVLVTFGALFMIAPRPADAGMPMYEPVPIALLAYGLFTLGRLVLAYRGSMPGWLLVLSILLDVTLLIGLIWSFHIQYGQDPAFSLKVPTFIYVFVFIALRALRFDHRFVLSAGLFAAVGWLLLVALTIKVSNPGAVTRSFAAYLNSNSILIGAEFDKIFTILLVTGILTFAVWRGRQLLVTAVREEAASREVKRFLSKGLAEAIAASDKLIEAGEAAERDAAILMLDIRGFTRFSTTVTPKEVVEMLTGFHARVLPVVQANGGVIDKFMGDGVMATFGALASSPTAAADALKALSEIMEEARTWSEAQHGARLSVNGAVAAGRVVFATLGSEERLEYTVIGEAVNLAAKLEKHNKAEGTSAITTVATLELALAQGYAPAQPVERRPGRSVAGVDRPVDLAVLSG